MTELNFTGHPLPPWLVASKGLIHAVFEIRTSVQILLECIFIKKALYYARGTIDIYERAYYTHTNENGFGYSLSFIRCRIKCQKESSKTSLAPE